MLTAGEVFIFVAPFRLRSFRCRESVPSLLLGSLKKSWTLPPATLDFPFAFVVIYTSLVEFASQLA